MNNNGNSKDNFERLHSGFNVITELEERIDDEDAQPQLGAARSHIANACQGVNNVEFDREFPKAMGMVASVAVSYGHDDLAETAMKVGGDGNGE